MTARQGSTASRSRFGGRLRRLVACTAVSILGLTVVSAPLAVAQSTTSVQANAAALPRCQTPGLVVWLDTTGNGAAGSSYYNLEFSNLSGHACALSGFPGVSAVTLTGSQLGVAANRTQSVPAVSVRLAPGAFATAILQITDAANFSTSACHEVLAAGIRVYPPGAVTSKLVPFPFEACSSGGAVFLHIQRVGKGTVGQ